MATEIERKIKLRRAHTITLKLVDGTLGNLMAFYIDGHLVRKERAPLHAGVGSFAFALDAIPLELRWRTNWTGAFTFVAMESNGRLMLLHGDRADADAYQQDFGVPPPLWTWLFVGACLLMPLTGVGWWAALVFGPAAAVSCYRTARDGYQPERLRLLICGGVALLAWILVYMLAAMATVIFGIAV